MTIDILTLFPEMFDIPLGQSIIGRAQAAGHVTIRCHQIRDFTTNRQNQVDDYPYGGGRGCVMQAQPLYAAWQYAKGLGGFARTIYFSPRGRVFTQTDAVRLCRNHDRLIFVCGHYEGVDQRFINLAVDEELSLGDFVLTGGEIPAMAVADAVCRLAPGVLADKSCYTDESHWNGLLEHPHYSRPNVWEGLEVPEVLLNGNHRDIDSWRRKQSLLATLTQRPDMFERLQFSKADLKLLGELRTETEDPMVQNVLGHLHTDRITVRRATERDAQYVTSQEGATTFAIYAEGHGFCGHITYLVKETVGQLELSVLPHAAGKGIDTFALARALEELFSEPGVEVCVCASSLSEDLVRRIGFSLGPDGQFMLPKTDESDVSERKK